MRDKGPSLTMPDRPWLAGWLLVGETFQLIVVEIVFLHCRTWPVIGTVQLRRSPGWYGMGDGL